MLLSKATYSVMYIHINFLSVCVFLGIEPTTFCTSNAMLYPQPREHIFKNIKPLHLKFRSDYISIIAVKIICLDCIFPSTLTVNDWGTIKPEHSNQRNTKAQFHHSSFDTSLTFSVDRKAVRPLGLINHGVHRIPDRSHAAAHSGPGMLHWLRT